MAVRIWVVVGVCIVGIKSGCRVKVCGRTPADIPVALFSIRSVSSATSGATGCAHGSIKAEFGSSFFSGDFRWGFNGGGAGDHQRVGIFPVGVVDAPQFIVRVHGQIHGSQ